jgi:hypothetical protein
MPDLKYLDVFAVRFFAPEITSLILAAGHLVVHPARGLTSYIPEGA